MTIEQALPAYAKQTENFLKKVAEKFGDSRFISYLCTIRNKQGIKGHED